MGQSLVAAAATYNFNQITCRIKKSNDKSNSVHYFKENSIVFILFSRTLYHTMHESSITWQSRNYDSSLFIESEHNFSHTLNSSSTSHTFFIVNLYFGLNFSRTY